MDVRLAVKAKGAQVGPYGRVEGECKILGVGWSQHHSGEFRRAERVRREAPERVRTIRRAEGELKLPFSFTVLWLRVHEALMRRTSQPASSEAARLLGNPA